MVSTPNIDKLKLVRRRELDEEDNIGPVDTSLELFKKVYRNPSLPLVTSLRAARDAKDYERAKRGVTVNVNDDGSFAARLDAAIARVNGAKLIEGTKLVESRLDGEPTEAEQVSASHSARPIFNGFN